jgi:DNA-binding response OmpR family regulator
VVWEAASGGEAVRRIAERAPALVMLDVTLPDVSGLQVCRRLRADEATRAVPIMMLSARGDELDRVVGLELGADDYVTKPFSPRELVARVRAVLRRAAPRGRAASASVLCAGRLVVDLDTHETRVDGRPVSLSTREFELLGFFIRHPEKVFSRAQVVDRVWRGSERMRPRSVDVHVRRLRRRLHGAGLEADVIVAVRGVGYRFDAEKAAAGG